MCPRFAQLVKDTQYANTAVSYSMNSYIGTKDIWANWLGAGVTGVIKETEVYRASDVMVFSEENTWAISGYSFYPFNDTHFTVGNSTRQIDNFGTFHNTGDRDQGGANMAFVDGHTDYRKRMDLDVAFRLAWPKQRLP
jgi:prepilin-type processing-associated H-X9-DG protein